MPVKIRILLDNSFSSRCHEMHKLTSGAMATLLLTATRILWYNTKEKDSSQYEAFCGDARQRWMAGDREKTIK
jgi:hypothetical protein